MGSQLSSRNLFLLTPLPSYSGQLPRLWRGVLTRLDDGVSTLFQKSFPTYSLAKLLRAAAPPLAGCPDQARRWGLNSLPEIFSYLLPCQATQGSCPAFGGVS